MKMNKNNFISKIDVLINQIKYDHIHNIINTDKYIDLFNKIAYEVETNNDYLSVESINYVLEINNYLNNYNYDFTVVNLNNLKQYIINSHEQN